MTNETPFHVRQGDVLLLATDEGIPETATLIPRVAGRIEIQRGEVTTHVHAIADEGATFYRLADGRRMVSLSAPCSLTHEEHAAIDLPEGDYEVRIQREYVAGELPRQVED